MNFQVQVSKERLDKTLGILKHALERRVTLPILQHILAEVNDHEMTLKATDMELAFEAVVPVEQGITVDGPKFERSFAAFSINVLEISY